MALTDDEIGETMRSQVDAFNRTKLAFFLEHGEAEARKVAGLPESDD